MPFVDTAFATARTGYVDARPEPHQRQRGVGPDLVCWLPHLREKWLNTLVAE